MKKRVIFHFCALPQLYVKVGPPWKNFLDPRMVGTIYLYIVYLLVSPCTKIHLIKLDNRKRGDWLECEQRGLDFFLTGSNRSTTIHLPLIKKKLYRNWNVRTIWVWTLSFNMASGVAVKTGKKKTKGNAVQDQSCYHINICWSFILRNGLSREIG